MARHTRRDAVWTAALAARDDLDENDVFRQPEITARLDDPPSESLIRDVLATMVDEGLLISSGGEGRGFTRYGDPREETPPAYCQNCSAAFQQEIQRITISMDVLGAEVDDEWVLCRTCASAWPDLDEVADRLDHGREDVEIEVT